MPGGAVPPSDGAAGLRKRSAKSAARMPIDALTLDAVCSAESTAPLPDSRWASYVMPTSHLLAGKPIAVPIMLIVPDVGLRMNIWVGSVQGETWYCWPAKPNTV